MFGLWGLVFGILSMVFGAFMVFFFPSSSTHQETAFSVGGIFIGVVALIGGAALAFL